MNDKKRIPIARRPFLAGLAGAGAAIFVRPLVAEAETGQAPRRFFMLHYPCGTVMGGQPGTAGGFGAGSKWTWLPGGSGPSYTASPLLELFAPIRSSCLTIHGLTRGDRKQKINGDKHTQGMVFMTTGYVPVPMVDAKPEFDPPNAKQITAATPSIDQQLLAKRPDLLRDALVPGGAPTRFPSLQLAASPRSMPGSGPICLKVISYADHDKPLAPEARTQVAFNNVFGGAMMPGVDPVVFQRQQANRRSILDFVRGDIARLQSKVPAGQRSKLDAQLTSIRSLESRISSMAPMTGALNPPTLVAEPAGSYESRVREVHQNMLGIIRCAFQSDLTRVASFTCGNGNNNDQVHNYFTPPSFNFRGDGHGCSHNGKSPDALLAKGEVSALFLGAAARFLTDLSKVPEGTGTTMLDNVFAMLYSECADGDGHSPWYPLLLAGGRWLKMNTGQHINVAPDRYVNDFWMPALEAWGVPTPTWGDPQYVEKPLTGIFG